MWLLPLRTPEAKLGDWRWRVNCCKFLAYSNNELLPSVSRAWFESICLTKLSLSVPID